ncbi:MAG: hypothetical protein ACTHZX_05750 [Microbacterium sp.]
MQGSEDDETDRGDGLMSRVRIVEEQPLAQRAEAYAALHDELARRLEQAPGEAPADR